MTVLPVTSIPGVSRWSPTQQQISNSRAFYPAVGLLLGLMLVGLERGCAEVFPDYLSAAVLLVSLIVANRGLHLDGLMDTCDGIFGGYTPERRLEIMGDSQVGAFAVAGAAGTLLLKYGAMVSLLGVTGSGIEWSLLVFPMLSRWSMVVALGAFPYVRTQGLGSPFHQGGIQGGIFWPTALAGITAVAGAVLLGSIAGAGMLVGATVVAWLLGKGIAAKLGGLTGDCYGAINEVIEVLALMAVAAIASHGWVEPLTSLLDIT